MTTDTPAEAGAQAPLSPGRSAPDGTPVETPLPGGTSPRRKLSGAQRRKAAKLKAQGRPGGAPARPLSVELLAPVRVEDLDTVAGYRRELNRVYGQMRAGQMPPEHGTKLVFVLCQGAGLARIEEELREAAALRDELIKLNSGRHGGQEYLPALHDGSHEEHDGLEAPPADDEGGSQ